MPNYIIARDDSNSLAHHGVKGQKWGVRRYQNPDGTLTAEGKRHNDSVWKGTTSIRADKQYRKEDRAEYRRLKKENKLAYKIGNKTKEEYDEDKKEIKREYKEQRKSSNELVKELKANNSIGKSWANAAITGAGTAILERSLAEIYKAAGYKNEAVVPSLLADAAILSIPVGGLIDQSQIKKQRRINEAKYGVTYNSDGTVNEKKN